MKKVPGYKLFIDEDLVLYAFDKCDHIYQPKPWTDQCGYLKIQAKTDAGKWTTAFVHRAIALAFVPNPDGKPTVDHKDRNRQNNVIDNLRWATQAEQNENSAKIINRKDYGVRSKDDWNTYQRAYQKEWRAKRRAQKASR